MICTSQSQTGRRSCRDSAGIPSADRIRQMTAEIRRSWSSTTHTRRAAEAGRRVELMVVSHFAVGDPFAACES